MKRKLDKAIKTFLGHPSRTSRLRLEVLMREALSQGIPIPRLVEIQSVLQSENANIHFVAQEAKLKEYSDIPRLDVRPELGTVAVFWDLDNVCLSPFHSKATLTGLCKLVDCIGGAAVAEVVGNIETLRRTNNVSHPREFLGELVSLGSTFENAGFRVLTVGLESQSADLCIKNRLRETKEVKSNVQSVILISDDSGFAEDLRVWESSIVIGLQLQSSLRKIAKEWLHLESLGKKDFQARIAN